MTDPFVSNGVPECERDVVLAEDFVEALRSKASVERLVAGVELFRCFGHVASLRRACDTRVTNLQSSRYREPRVIETPDMRGRRRVQQPGRLRHPERSAESCCLPTLTRFTGFRRAEPGYCTRRRVRSSE